jgi:3-hydroxyisobutyrate dehydrogenase
MTTVAVLGLGAMGARMATRLLQAGHAVTVWNRPPGRAAALVEAGAKVAATPRAAAAQAQLVVSMVRDDEASRAVWLAEGSGALAGMAPDSLALESSTLSLPWVRALAQRAAQQRVGFLDAPVAGSRPQAEAGQLSYFVGGDPALLERARPVLLAMGAAVHHAGPTGAGAAVKLAVNALLAVQVTALAELLAMLRSCGLEPARAVELLAATPVCGPAAKVAAGSMVASAFAPAFPVELVEKDLGYLLEAAQAGAPLAQAARAVFAAARAKGLGGQHLTVVSQLYPQAPKEAPMTPLYTATATNAAGREGKVSTDDRALEVSLSFPKALGGPGTAGTTNPEQLFAAGYASCFGATLRVVGQSQKLDASQTTVVAKVAIGKDATSFALAVELIASNPTLTPAQLRGLMEGAHALCPYSKATRGNVEVKLSVS